MYVTIILVLALVPKLLGLCIHGSQYVDELSAGRETLCNRHLRSYHT